MDSSFHPQGSANLPPREMLTYVSPGDGFVRRKVIRTFENLSGRRRLMPIYQNIMQREVEGHELWAAALEELGISLQLDQAVLDRVPKDGPLILIANHPFGIVDGLALGSIAARLRPNFSFLVHEALIHQDPRLANFLLPVDFRDIPQALQTNIETRNTAVKRLMAGEALAIFPGGGVSTAHKGFGQLREFEWKRFVANVIHKSKATVLPMYFHGQNSRIFHLVSQVSATARLGLLLHEIRNKIGKPVQVKLGEPIPFSEMQQLGNRQELLDHLYATTMALGGLPPLPTRKG